MAMFKRILSAALALVLLLSCIPMSTAATGTEEITIATEAPTEGATEGSTEAPAEEPTEATEEITEEPAEPTEEPEAPTEAPAEEPEEPAAPTEEPVEETTAPTEATEEAAGEEPDAEPNPPEENPDAGADGTAAALEITGITSASEATEQTVVVFASGDGTEENPYQVATAEQLDTVRKDLSAHYIQVADIDLNGCDWTPIGYRTYSNETSYFTGTYDGNGYKIQHLCIDKFDEENMAVGLFGASQGTIKNVYLENCDINIDASAGIGATAWPTIGCVVGISSTMVSGCTTTGNLNVSNAYYVNVGGIAGYATCSNSTNYVNVTVEGIDYSNRSGEVHCGGIVGHTSSVNGTVTNCVNYGNIFASGDTFCYCGGISGKHGAIDSCINYGDVKGTIIAYKGWSSFAAVCAKMM